MGNRGSGGPVQGQTAGNMQPETKIGISQKEGGREIGRMEGREEGRKVGRKEGGREEWREREKEET